MSTLKLFLLLSICSYLLAGCFKENVIENVTDEGSSEFSIADGEGLFNFSLLDTISFSLTYKTQGIKIPFNVYTENPYRESDGRIYIDSLLNSVLSGFTDLQGNFNNEEVLIPSGTKRLYITAPSLYAPMLLNEDATESLLDGEGLPLTSDNFSYTEITKSIGIKASGEDSDWAHIDVGANYATVGSTDKLVRLYDQYDGSTCYPSNSNADIYSVITNDTQITENSTVNQLSQRLYQSLFHWNGNTYTDNQNNLIYSANDDVTILNETASGKKIKGSQIDVNFLSAGGSYNSTLAYYYYPVSDKNIVDADYLHNLKKYIVIPRGYKGHPTEKIKIRLQYFGENYDQNGVDIFPDGITIGWMIIVNISNFGNNGGVNLGDNPSVDQLSKAQSGTYAHGNYVYSNSIGNALVGNISAAYSDYMGEPAPGCAYLYDEDAKCMVVGFEDLAYKGEFTSIYNCNFTDILFYISFNTILESESETNSIPVSVVSIPRTSEYVQKTATKTYTGTLAFEDVWPTGGDYDLNDFVLEYKTIVKYTDDNVMLSVDDYFTPTYDGASYLDAFGYQIASDELGSVDFTASSDGIIQEEENQFLIITSANSGISYRGAITNKTTYHLRRNFDSSFNYSDYHHTVNPFIVPDYTSATQQERGKRYEIHLPGHSATNWADMSLINTADDWCYVDKDGKYPFAIDLPVTGWQVNPTEIESIDKKAYPDFKTWADSDGEEETDWYNKYSGGE